MHYCFVQSYMSTCISVSDITDSHIRSLVELFKSSRWCKHYRRISDDLAFLTEAKKATYERRILDDTIVYGVRLPLGARFLTYERCVFHGLVYSSYAHCANLCRSDCYIFDGTCYFVIYRLFHYNGILYFDCRRLVVSTFLDDSCSKSYRCVDVVEESSPMCFPVRRPPAKCIAYRRDSRLSLVVVPCIYSTS
jgi:hypothetical protein